MEAECLRENLLKSLGVVGHIVPTRPNLPILSNIYLKTKDHKLTFFGTDLEIGAESSIPVKVISEGSVLVPARLFLDYISTNQDQVIALKKENNFLVAQSEHYKATFSIQDEKDFPPIPTSPKATEIKLPIEKIMEGLKLIIIACSSDETRPILNGVYILHKGNKLILVATDSYRLAECKINLEDSPLETIQPVVLPKRIIQEVIRTLPLIISEVNKIKMVLSDKEVRFVLGETQIYSRPIEGNFPDYEKVIPKNFTTEVELSRADFLSLVKTVSVFNKEFSGSTKVLIEENLIKLRSSSEVGQLESLGKAEVKGEIVETTFNTRFLLDVLSVLPSKKVVFSLNGKSEPAKIFSPEFPDYQYIMMPLRIE